VRQRFNKIRPAYHLVNSVAEKCVDHNLFLLVGCGRAARMTSEHLAQVTRQTDALCYPVY